ncbi:hypothetical protein GPA10_24845 [Streptomyces sp. p1417]|uniref:Uncharacterized protein n=1 Tax=Streptomyces typhae TaxID=2681492 RepID=A0A6L6X2F2_9ACTN|nr:hypothetical protein [Streptomyces typhae]MVO87896.1 hypothetical protein [Streptomyces typhae]
MNTRLVTAAADVIHAAQTAGTQTATGLACALDAAQLLQSPCPAALPAPVGEGREPFYAMVDALGPDVTAALDQRLDTFRALVLAEAQAEVVAWLRQKAREIRGLGGTERSDQADVVEALASTVQRGAVRIFVTGKDRRS